MPSMHSQTLTEATKPFQFSGQKELIRLSATEKCWLSVVRKEGSETQGQENLISWYSFSQGWPNSNFINLFFGYIIIDRNVLNSSKCMQTVLLDGTFSAPWSRKTVFINLSSMFFLFFSNSCVYAVVNSSFLSENKLHENFIPSATGAACLFALQIKTQPARTHGTLHLSLNTPATLANSRTHSIWLMNSEYANSHVAVPIYMLNSEFILELHKTIQINKMNSESIKWST